MLRESFVERQREGILPEQVRRFEYCFGSDGRRQSSTADLKLKHFSNGQSDVESGAEATPLHAVTPSALLQHHSEHGNYRYKEMCRSIIRDGIIEFPRSSFNGTFVQVSVDLRLIM
jgi:hypothetical protein